MTLEPPGAPTREFVLRYAPEAQRAALGALLEIEREVAAAARDGLDHSVAHARLAWWQEELGGLAAARPRHPAARTLTAVAATAGRSPPDLGGLVEIARIDLARVAFLEREELDHYLGHWATGLFRPVALLGLEALDPATAAAERFAAVVGPVVREIELLSAVAVHARAGRVFVPLGDPPRPHAPWYAEPLGSSECAELEARLETLLATLRRAAGELPAPARAPLTAALIWTGLAARTARLTVRRLPQALRPTRSEPLRRTIAAWHAAVSAARGRLPRPIRL